MMQEKSVETKYAFLRTQWLAVMAYLIEMPS